MSTAALPEKCRLDLSTVRWQVKAGGIDSRLVAAILNCALTSDCEYRDECLANVRGLLDDLPAAS